MSNKTIGYLIIGCALLGGGIYAYTFFKKGGTGNNFDALQKNLNVSSEGGVVTIAFNDNQNKAQFYNNDRVVIFNNKNAEIMKGTFVDGGKTIKIDSSFGGKTVSGTSVYKNLINLLN